MIFRSSATGELQEPAGRVPIAAAADTGAYLCPAEMKLGMGVPSALRSVFRGYIANERALPVLRSGWVTRPGQPALPRAALPIAV